MLTQEVLQEWFYYKDGNLYAKKYRVGIQVGKKVGHLSAKGYLMFTFQRKAYYIHKCIFILVHGYAGENTDHIDGDKLNNKIENLRASTAQQNNWNKSGLKNASSKYKGVSLRKDGKWLSCISLNGKTVHLGLFKNERAAALAYLKQAQIHHGEFCNVKRSA